jgi:RND family efflux transporter MFP subunit
MDTRMIKRLLAATTLLAALAGCGAKRDTAGTEAALLSPRDLSPVTRTDLATGLPVQGTLEPSVDVSVIAPYPEVLDAVLVKEGQAVRQGDVLARFRMESIRPASIGAEAQRRTAAADYARMKNLLQEGAVAPRDLESAEAGLRAAEAQAALMKKHLDDATVRAPFDGVVAQRFVHSGDRVADAALLFRIVNTTELEFAATVPTEALGSVHPGAPVALTVSGLEGDVIAGRVARVNSTVDPATRQVKVYVAVPNRDHRVAGDMFASGRIVLAEVKSVLAVPTAGVRGASGGVGQAWVVAGGRAEQRRVTTGVHDEARDLVEIRSGLKEGESVVVSPIGTLSQGQAVQVAGDGTPAATAPAQAGKAAAATRGKGR